MADGLLALSNCIVQTFKKVDDIRRAPDEVRHLKEQADILYAILNASNGVQAPTQLHHLMKDISVKAERILDDVRHLLSLELPKKGDSLISRRSARWLKNNDKFATANAQLRDLQFNFLLALSLQSSSLPAISSLQQPIQQSLAGPSAASEHLVVELSTDDHQHDRPEEAHSSHRTPSPAGSFEMSAGFMPELYTTDTSPNLFSFKSVQLDMSEYTMTNLYAMFYRTSGRRWIRIHVSVTVNVESELFLVGQLPPSSIKVREPVAPITRELVRFLESQGALQSDVHLSLYVGRDFPNIPASRRLIQDPIKLTSPTNNNAITELKTATSLLYHANCPRISETHILQYPKPAYSKAFFISQCGSDWMLDFRFTLDEVGNHGLLYQLRALQRLLGRPRICQLIGVIVGIDDGTIKGFLTRLPERGELFRLVAVLKRQKLPIPWTRRERWCRDIVQAVASAHSTDVLVGGLGRFEDRGICLDEDDHPVLYSFRPFYNYDSQHPANIPPEHRQSLGGSRNGILPSTPHTDIFQLGLTIWIIASIETSCTQSEIAFSSHHLPRLSGDVPDYVNEIIALCRAKDPCERKAAWELLQMFPPETDDTQDTVENDSWVSGSQDDSGETLHELARHWSVYSKCGYCDLCREAISGTSYSCIICSNGNFDICQSCFAEGRHCKSSDHYLSEERQYGTDAEGTKSIFHTSVKNGRRETLDLNLNTDSGQSEKKHDQGL